MDLIPATWSLRTKYPLSVKKSLAKLTKTLGNQTKDQKTPVCSCILVVGWFPVLTRAYDNNGRCPRQKLVFGILQLWICILVEQIPAFRCNYPWKNKGLKSRPTWPMAWADCIIGMHTASIYLHSVHSFFADIYIAPLQWNYSEALAHIVA